MAVRFKIKLAANQERYIILRRIVKLAAAASLIGLLVMGLVLYLVRLPFMQDIVTSFTYVTEYQENELPQEKPLPKQSLHTAGSAAGVPDITVPAIDVSSAVKSVDTMIVSEFGSDFSDMSVDMTSLGLALDLGDSVSVGNQGSGGSGKGKGKGNGWESASSRRLKGYNDDVQVVLALDASGSMSTLFAAVAGAMDRMLTTLAAGQLNGKKIKVNVGVVVYGQGANNGAPFVLSKFTTKVKSLKSKLEAQACDGGNEECGRAIKFALDNFPWNQRDRDDMLKVIFICGDEPFNQGEVDYKLAIKMAVARHIIVNTVHCGGKNSEWEEAAILAKGKGLAFMRPNDAEPAEQFQEKRSGEEDTAAQELEVLSKLQRIQPLVAGSPSEQKELMKKFSIPPKPTGKKGIGEWVKKYRLLLTRGFEWDLVEQCRIFGDDYITLERLGGRGNLPLSLRGMSDQEAIEAIRRAAHERQALLQEYQDSRNTGDLAGQLLEVLQEQAEERGIILTL